jgi:hypothetical protein
MIDLEQINSHIVNVFNSYNITNEYVILFLFSVVILTVISSYFNLTVIYKDYNDLALSCAVLALPFISFLLLAMAANFFSITISNSIVIIISLSVFSLTFILLIINTFKNNGLLTLIPVIVTKLLLSGVFIINLYLFFTASTRKEKGKHGFVALVLGMLLTSLVKENIGILKISSNGRVSSGR